MVEDVDNIGTTNYGDVAGVIVIRSSSIETADGKIAGAVARQSLAVRRAVPPPHLPVSRVRFHLVDEVLAVTATNSGGRSATIVCNALTGLHRANVWHHGAVSAAGIALPDDVLGNEVASGDCLAAVDWSSKSGQGQRG